MWQLCTRRPIQYVIEEWDFRDLTLKMRPPVFIPRPETEELVELMLTDLETKPGAEVGADGQRTCLEVGCGSGAISLSLLNSMPQVRLGLQDRLQVYRIDVLKDAETVVSLCSPVSALVSNPPYLFSEDLTSLEPEIFRFEDHAALDGGKDGLKVIKQILTVAPQILTNHGRVYLEVDPRHPPLIQRWVEANVEEMHYVETRHDINGRPRFCIIQKKKSNKDHRLDQD
ncbi:HemK methyltransferase family member 1 [Collichthys lucidus]|uniref:HemK methyltransferase family member 1 n=1 Tax=Collichthys lucidus TaxID=240159 RepID=A0A4U5UBF1_COLLU|nr:HemK methyltransferase family member 1 [Collichthys lucidus]